MGEAIEALDLLRLEDVGGIEVDRLAAEVDLLAGQVDPLQQVLAPAERHRADRELHLVDQARHEVLANRRDSVAHAHVHRACAYLVKRSATRSSAALYRGMRSRRDQ